MSLYDKEEKKQVSLIITSIQSPTESVKSFSKIQGSPFRLILIGDEKSPPSYSMKEVDFLAIKDQIKVFPEFAKVLPLNNYSRKNIGYLYAMQLGSEVIVETDDDNFPYEHFPVEFDHNVSGNLVRYNGWGNVYGFFSKHNIWPRGLPLDCINTKEPIEQLKETCFCPIQQYLVDGDPDVDAIYRLIIPQDKIIFNKREPIILAKNSFCPFNSQNTVWFPDVYELMYLPSYTSFRMTDIWRSFIAQICMHAVNMNLSFHSATAYQNRNAHDLMKDFSDEVSGYLHNREIIDTLLSLQLSSNANDIGRNFFLCWEALYKIGLVPHKEILLCKAWLEIVKICKSRFHKF